MTVQPKSPDASATVTELFTGVPSSTTTAGEDMYDDVELKTNTENEPAARAQCEEIELSTNAAYGKVQRSAFQIATTLRNILQLLSI